MDEGSAPSSSRPSNNTKSFKESPPEPSIAVPHLLDIYQLGDKVVWYENVHPSEYEYEEVQDLILNESFIIEKLVRIQAPYLKRLYELKRQQKINEYGSVSEVRMFHGTKKSNLDSICTHNFDWRLYGTNNGHRFGKGVAFTPNAMWASNYGDAYSEHGVMILAQVLVANACLGNSDMELPYPGFDTSQKDEFGIVTVKYEDHEFLPLYKIYYRLEHYVEKVVQLMCEFIMGY